MGNQVDGGKGFTQAPVDSTPMPAYDLNAVDNGFTDAGEAIIAESGVNTGPASNQQAQTIAVPGSTISQQVITPLNHLGAKLNSAHPIFALAIVALAVVLVVKLSK